MTGKRRRHAAAVLEGRGDVRLLPLGAAGLPEDRTIGWKSQSAPYCAWQSTDYTVTSYPITPLGNGPFLAILDAPGYTVGTEMYLASTRPATRFPS